MAVRQSDYYPGKVRNGGVQPLEVPAPNEELGQNGPLVKLPGNNLVTGSL